MSDDVKAKDNPKRYPLPQFSDIERDTPLNIIKGNALVDKLTDKLFDEMDLPMELTPKYAPLYAYPVAPYDPTKEFEVWEIHKEHSGISLGKTSITIEEDGSVDIKVTPIELAPDDIYDLDGEEQEKFFKAQAEAVLNHSDEGDHIMGDESEVTDEFLEKQQKLSAVLLEMATGLSWDDEEAIEMHANYTADANDILRGNPHLLGLTTREAMNLDEDKNE